MSDRTRLIFSQVKRFLVVAVVTLLIWLLAESESVRVEKVPVDLSFKPDVDATRLVSVEGSSVVQTTITLQGPAAGVDALAGKIRSKLISIQPGMDGVPADPGRRTIDLREVIRGLPAVRESGVAVAGVEPQGVQVQVDNLVTRDARVKVIIPDGQLLEGVPEPSPATVRLRLPESVSSRLTEDPELIARLDPAALANLTEGRRLILSNVPVELPESLRGLPGVRVQPQAVSVAVIVRGRTDSTLVPTVPVHIRLAPTETGLWDIQVPPESRQLTDVTISGPADQVQLIKSGKLIPIAYIPLSFEDLEQAAQSGNPIEKEPIFCELPTPLRFDTRQKTIQVLVKRRESSAPGGPASSPNPGGG